MMNNILVSIQCITYNHEKYIGKAIDSFLMQKTNFKYEILIHDDASTDNTQNIIRKYAKKYPDIIKPILQSENQTSKGVKKINYRFNHIRSNGKYIAICEGDDYWTDEYKLQKQVDYMEKNQRCSMCFHAVDIISKNLKVGTIRPYYKSCNSSTEDIILGDGGFIGTNSILFKKSIMDNAPEFYLKAPVGDYPLQILASAQGYAYYIDEIMSAYRINVPGSWTTINKVSSNRDERNISVKKGLIQMLNDFDIYSNKKYHKTIKHKILENEFDILKIQGNIKEIKREKYSILYENLKYKEKIKIYLKRYCPKLYQIICNIKYKNI